MTKNSQELAANATKIYEQRLKEELEKTHFDYFLAIEPDSGDHFLGGTLSEAAAAARKAHPGRRAFLLRVGHRTAVHIGAAHQ